MIIDFHDFSHQPPLPVMFLRSNEYHSFRHDNLGFRGLTYLIPVFSVNSDRSQSEPICRIFYPAKDVIQAFCFPCIFLQSDNCQTPVIGYVINIGVCIGLVPVIGLTLPFFSYGGSSLVTMFFAMGIVSGINMRPAPDSSARYIRPPLSA